MMILQFNDEQEKPIPKPFMAFAWEPKDAPDRGYPKIIQGVVRFNIEFDKEKDTNFMYAQLHSN
jgi:hypothetical protein